jgi:hypothetical protein
MLLAMQSKPNSKTIDLLATLDFVGVRLDLACNSTTNQVDQKRKHHSLLALSF